ncbi:MAG TPA: xanthine dehydrogenase family protein subunit M [Candidatus Binatia bacterium]|jgi:carbon-monoxide dehydrogenase medium subunit
MKPAPFEYFAPATLDEALELLHEYGDEAKLLAGGQSLMPLMNLRLARPKVIVDINRVSGLDEITTTAAGGLAIGALARQRTVEKSALVRERSPLLAAALPLIGHFQIRNRGTIGGSIAHADPAAELPAVSLLLGCEFALARKGSTRLVAAADFFLGYLATAIEPGELLTEIRVPQWRGGTVWAIDEIARRKGDFALVGVALCAELNDGGSLRDIAIVMFGVGGKPQRMESAGAILKGRPFDQSVLRALTQAIAQELEPDSDVHASAAYRKEVGGVLARRALQSALARPG